MAEKAWLDDRQNLKVGVVEISAPILYFEAGQTMGLAADYLRALAAKLGLNLDLVNYNSVDALVEGLRSGEIDLIGAMVHSATTPADLHFSRPYISLPTALYAKQKLSVKEIAGLQGQEVAVTTGTIWEELLPHYLPGIKSRSFASLESALQSVVDGRMPVYLGDTTSVEYLLAGGRFKGLKVTQQLDLTMDVALVTHAATPALHSLLQKAIDRLSLDELHEIWNNWPEVENTLPNQSSFFVNLLWGVLLISWSLILIWIVNRRSKHGLEHHRSKTRRSIKRLRKREELLKHKLLELKHKTKRYRSRAKSLRRQVDFTNHVLPCASWAWDPAKGECLWEEDMFALVGMKEGDFQPTSDAFLELVHPQDRELVSPLFVENSIEPSKISYRLILPDETEMVLLQYSHIVGAEDNEDARRVSICWRIDQYTGGSKRQHLSIVPTTAPISDEESGE
ncbi:MAG: transporter substrate-binding domain-containing protein [Candidatus Thiodiazotropha weberae]|nr:transporter substrate-binding domain-containing protein [Candidatus Thiodiazotropha lotti]MCG7986687.1 transporter substrate-binding domain-containing protein [Candidatus Thiodiazotropha lotti]MCG8011397.1 transporter substrate-binding domain-containing protein [Candidatus Thiodiazotropha lotti]MCG8022050.1 transporter substrate-binding domain-containing protein [Candidatus Thiodiazotropha lotti]MCW4209223.1 transporter substrate-binding domain-containing protein [Candidatus Thiodiazotropha 